MRGGGIRDDRRPTRARRPWRWTADGLEDAATALRLETWRRFAAHQARRARGRGANAPERGGARRVARRARVPPLPRGAPRGRDAGHVGGRRRVAGARQRRRFGARRRRRSRTARRPTTPPRPRAGPRRGLLVGPRGRGGQRRGLCVRHGARDAARLATRCSTGSRARARSSRPTRASGGRWRAGRPTRLWRWARGSSHGEALAGTAQVLANISEATGLELEEGVVDPGLARRGRGRDRTLRTKLVEAQVALNGLDAACEAHLGRLRLHLEDEVGASYGRPRRPGRGEATRGRGGAGRRGSAGEKDGDALEKARAALASTALAQPIARSIAGRGDVGARASRSATATRSRRTAGRAPRRSTRPWAVSTTLAPRRAAPRNACMHHEQHGASGSLQIDVAPRAGTRRPPATRLLEEPRDRARVKRRAARRAAARPGRARLRAALAAGLGGGVEVAAAVREGLGPRSTCSSARPRRPRRGVGVVSRCVAPTDGPGWLYGGGRAGPGGGAAAAAPTEDAELALMWRLGCGRPVPRALLRVLGCGRGPEREREAEPTPQ